MRTNHTGLLILMLFAIGIVVYAALEPTSYEAIIDREEVVFWHFWGGEDRAVVEEVVRRFNASQDKHFVRAVAMPGNNLDVKLFLAVTGGDPPDLINQDDPIIADWASRGALTPLDELASPDEIERLNRWLFPAARKLCEYDGRHYGLCNGLDIRALYYNKTLFEENNVPLPQTPEDLSNIAQRLSLVDDDGRYQRFGYLPDSRRLWAWAIAFGGEFYDSERGVTADSAPVVEALDWMQSFSQRFAPERVAAFRQGDQSLPGKTFPLLPTSDDSPHGRYAMILDGQWRVRDIQRTTRQRREDGLAVAEYGVAPLPHPSTGRPDAGWVNGNFFLVPRGAKCSAGAWEFMKFWSGFDGNESAAATTCTNGGWIPVSQKVVDEPVFRSFLNDQPLFRKFVDLAGSENQYPVPIVRGAALFNREIKNVGGEAMADPNDSPRELLQQATKRIQAHLDRMSDSE